MFQGETASISIETAFETALGLGDFLSIPVGVSYNQIYGLGAEGTLAADDSAFTSSGPWFYGDSLLPYAMLKLNVPLGPVYIEAFGGGALNYNFSTRPFEAEIVRDLRDAGAIGTPGSAIAPVDVTIETGLGFGWVAGAGFGVQFGQIRVGVDATYRHIYHPLTVSGRYLTPNSAESTFDSSDDGFAVENLRMIMQGISFGIGGSFSM
jgi:hypothetical protein